MHIIDRLKVLLFQPASFFTHLKKEEGVKTAFQFQALISLIGVFLPLLILLAIPSLKTVFITKLTKVLGQEFATKVLQPHVLPFIGALDYGVNLLLTFASAAVLFVLLKLFGARQPYAKAYQLSIYSKAPSTLLGWLPIVNIFTSIYSFVLLWKGTKIMYDFSTKKILMMYLIVPLLVLVILIGLAALVGVSLLKAVL